MQSLVNKLVSELQAFNPVVKKSNTGSFYISFTNSKIVQIRVSNHSGHRLKPNVWELRTDAMSKRSARNRIYNFKSINQMIRDFK